MILDKKKVYGSKLRKSHSLFCLIFKNQDPIYEFFDCEPPRTYLFIRKEDKICAISVIKNE